MSSAGDAVENGVTESFLSVAPTVRTCGHDAGYVVGLPAAPLFPAAATTRQPLCCAASTASCSSGFGVAPPKLRLITPGHGASSMPAAAAKLLMSFPSGLASKTVSAAFG